MLGRQEKSWSTYTHMHTHTLRPNRNIESKIKPHKNERPKQNGAERENVLGGSGKYGKKKADIFVVVVHSIDNGKIWLAYVLRQRFAACVPVFAYVRRAI